MQEYRCEKCEAIMQTRPALDAHQEIFHPRDGRKPGRQSLTAPVVFRCAFCGREFARHQQVSAHLETRHRGDLRRRRLELARRSEELAARGGRKPRRRRRSSSPGFNAA